MAKRLKASEAEAAQDGLILTEAQLAALAKQTFIHTCAKVAFAKLYDRGSTRARRA